MFRLCLLLMSFCLVPVVYATPLSCKDHQCIIVVDAGSTGSRLHLYAYDLDIHHSPIQIHELFYKQVKPGFASLDLSQTSINQYLESLFDTSLPQNVPVYFSATGGMRLLPQQKQKIYYDKLNHWFASQTQWMLKSAKTISGTNEGMYGWLAVNYGLGKLSSDFESLVGVMDTGGASVQLSFPIKHFEAVDPKDRVDIEIYGHSISLFVHSFLGIGQNEVLHQFIGKEDCFPNDYLLSNGLFAHGDFTSCKDTMSQWLFSVHHVDTIAKLAIESNPTELWYAIGGLSYMVQAPPFVFNGNQFTIENIAAQADSMLCHESWSFLNMQYLNDEYLFSYCLNASLYYALLAEGYGLRPSQDVRYFPIEDNDNDWTLGVVLHPE